jgi:hypothetical protein
MNLTNSSSVTEDTVHLNLAEVAYHIYPTMAGWLTSNRSTLGFRVQFPAQ